MNYREQLTRHLEFIRRSCESYDAGDKAEGLRIAVSLRVLFHDTNHCTSLMTHLKLKLAFRGFSAT